MSDLAKRVIGRSFSALPLTVIYDKIGVLIISIDMGWPCRPHVIPRYERGYLMDTIILDSIDFKLDLNHSELHMDEKKIRICLD